MSKYLEAPPSDQWGNSFSTSTPIWRQPSRNQKQMNVAAQYYSGEDTGCVYSENWREHDTELHNSVPIATPHGTISLRLRNRIRVDMTVDRAVRIINFKVFPQIHFDLKKFCNNFYKKKKKKHFEISLTEEQYCPVAEWIGRSSCIVASKRTNLPVRLESGDFGSRCSWKQQVR